MVVEVKGRILGSVSVPQVIIAADWYRRRSGGKCVQIHPALDDLDKRFDYEAIRRETIEGNFTGFRKVRRIDENDIRGGGFTIYHGSKTSDRYCRWYDKYIESKGERDSQRWESVFKGDLADQYLDLFIGVIRQGKEKYESLLATVIGSVTVGWFRYGKRASGDDKNKRETHLDRVETYDWWESFINEIGKPIKLKKPMKKTTYEDGKNWLVRQGSQLIAMIVSIEGVGELMNILEIGMSRINNPNNPNRNFKQKQISQERSRLGFAIA
jgi:phage replication initiation protein